MYVHVTVLTGKTEEKKFVWVIVSHSETLAMCEIARPYDVTEPMGEGEEKARE